MLCIAKGAFEVAAAEAYEDRRRPRIEAFTLKGIEYLINPEHVDCFVVPPRNDD